MPTSFTDSVNRQWNIDITTARGAAVEGAIGRRLTVDLLTEATPELLTVILGVLCADERHAKGIDADDFAASLPGPAMLDGYAALIEAAAERQPDKTLRANFRRTASNLRHRAAAIDREGDKRTTTIETPPATSNPSRKWYDPRTWRN